jgi:hypothetical protein
VSVEGATPPILSPQRVKKITEPLNVKMHRKLYPELYEKSDERNWKATSNVVVPRSRRPEVKKMDEKWAPAMREKGVQRHLSTYPKHNFTLYKLPIPISIHCLKTAKD